MEIYFWLTDKKSGVTMNEPSLRMTYYSGGFLGGHWQRIINSYPDIPNFSFSNYWLQFYFLATDKTGAQTKSQTYPNLVTFSACGYLH